MKNYASLRESRHIFIIFLLTIILSNMDCSSVKGEDVIGLDKAKLGMTIEEFLQNYNITFNAKGIETLATLNNKLIINGYRYDVSLKFINNRLSYIAFTAGLMGISNEPKPTKKQFQDMERILRDKYGKPTEERQGFITWVSTTMTVGLEGLPDYGIRIFYDWRLKNQQKLW